MPLSHIIRQSKGERELKYVQASQKGQEMCTENEDIWLHQLCIREQKQSSPEEEVSVSMATTEEQPRVSEYGRGVLAPLLLPESQHKRMKTVNQYEQTAGPDGGGRVLLHSRVVTPLSAVCTDSVHRLMPGNICWSCCSSGQSAASMNSSKLKGREDGTYFMKIGLGTGLPLEKCILLVGELGTAPRILCQLQLVL